MRTSEEGRDRLIIFARYPRAGRAKTRLIPSLGADGAADIYRAFLLDSIERWSGAGMFETVVAVADEDDFDPMRALIEGELAATSAPIGMMLQRGSDLGERMINALDDAFIDGCRRVCVIGSDHPTLPLAHIAKAFDTATCDIVVGESEDGGYWMIGMERPYPELLRGMPYSTNELFGATMRRAQLQGLVVHAAGLWYDVDDESDLARLCSDRELLERGTRTRTVIDAIISTGRVASEAKV